MAKAPIPTKRATDVDYEIVRFYPEALAFDVVFDGNPNDWARVQLQAPLPTTIEELEEQIQRHTPKKEEIELRSAPFDRRLVEDLVGVKRNMPRFSIAAKMERDRAQAEEDRARREAEAATAETPGETVAELQIAEEEWIDSIVGKRIEAMIAAGRLVAGPRQ